MVCASIVDSSASIHTLLCAKRTASIERADVGDVADLLVVEHPVAELLVEQVHRALADADHVRADRGQPAHELALVRREGRLDEDDVHAQILPAASLPARARPAYTRGVRCRTPSSSPRSCCPQPCGSSRPRRSLPDVRLGLISQDPEDRLARRPSRGALGPLPGQGRHRPPADRRRNTRAVTPSRRGGPAHRHARAAAGSARRGARRTRHPRHGRRGCSQLPRQGAHEDGVRGAWRPLRAASPHQVCRRGTRRGGRSRLSPRRQAACGRRRPLDIPHR